MFLCPLLYISRYPDGPLTQNDPSVRPSVPQTPCHVVVLPIPISNQDENITIIDNFARRRTAIGQLLSFRLAQEVLRLLLLLLLLPRAWKNAGSRYLIHTHPSQHA